MILAIDPGPVESAYAQVSRQDRKPDLFGIVGNYRLLDLLIRNELPAGIVAIEQIGHYGAGMPAGRSVFDTCRWIGRFEQALSGCDVRVDLTMRVAVKAHLCGSAKAKDGNVIQALVDRFAPNTPNRGKGTKGRPGWFYGFKADVWQAYALAVFTVDQLDAGIGGM